MFHTVSIQSLFSFNSVQLKPPEFLRVHVKRLCLTFGAISMDAASEVLSTCESLVDLAFWLGWSSGRRRTTPNIDKSTMAHVISQLPRLRRAELPYEQLVEIEKAQSLPLWSTNLTHLEVLYWTLSSTGKHIDVPLLRELTSLTHLCIDWRFYVVEIHEKEDVTQFLTVKPSLQVLVIDTGEGQIADGHKPIDIRVVYYVEDEDPVDEWKDEGPRPGKWTWAEAEVANRRRLRSEGAKQEEELVLAMQNISC
jgi:hypothetical protein